MQQNGPYEHYLVIKTLSYDRKYCFKELITKLTCCKYRNLRGENYNCWSKQKYFTCISKQFISEQTQAGKEKRSIITQLSQYDIHFYHSIISRICI